MKKIVLGIVIVVMAIAWVDNVVACPGQTEKEELINSPQSDKTLNDMEDSGVRPDENAAIDIEPIEIGLLYFKTARKPVPWEDFAGYWEEYRTAKDEFEKADVLTTLIPKLQEMKKHVDTHKTFIVCHKTSLGKYNMVTGKFTVNGLEDLALSAGTWQLHIKGPEYAIVFKNLKEFKELVMNKDTAREIADKLGPGRKIRLIFTFEPKSVYNDAYPHGGFGFLTALFKTRYRVIGSRIITLRIENPADGEMLYKIEAKPRR